MVRQGKCSCCLIDKGRPKWWEDVCDVDINTLRMLVVKGDRALNTCDDCVYLIEVLGGLEW